MGIEDIRDALIIRERSSYLLTDPNGKDWTFKMADDAKIRLADKEAKANDLKLGDKMTVVYTKQGNDLTVQDVQFDTNLALSTMDTMIASGVSGFLIVVPEQKVGPAVMEKAAKARRDRATARGSFIDVDSG